MMLGAVQAFFLENLKEDENAHLILTVAFKWPSASTAQLVVSIRHKADIGHTESGIPSCTFGG